MKYYILNTKLNLIAEWNHKAIIFDTGNEAQEFVNNHPRFCIQGEYKIERGDVTDINDTINYKDIKESDDKPVRKTLNEVLSDELSADKVKNMTVAQLAYFLTDNKIVLTESDINMLIVEAIQRAVADDDEFPIHYYDKTEPMSETGKIVEDPGEMLTDSLVHKMKGTYGD